MAKFKSKFTGEEIDERLSLAEEVRNKANADGYYRSMTAGKSDNLVGRGEATDEEFTFRSSAGDVSIEDGTARIKAIKGNTVVWNQLCLPIVEAFAGEQIGMNRVSITTDGQSVICQVTSLAYNYTGIYYNSQPTIATHKYFGYFVYESNKTATVKIGIGYETNPKVVNAGVKTPIYAIMQGFGGAVGLVMSSSLEGMDIGDTYKVSDFTLIDLTQMFGAGNEPTTVEEFYQRKPMNIADEYAYNEGELIDMNVDKLVSVGDNLLNINLPIVQAPVGYTPTTSFDFLSFDKAYSGIAYNGYTYSRGDLLTQKIEGGVTVQGNLSGYGLGIFFKAIPNAKYIADWQGDATVCVGFLDATKKVFHSETWVRDTRNLITAPAAAKYGVIVIRSAYEEEDVTATNIGLYLVHSGYKVDDIKYIPYEQDVKDVSWVNEIKNDGELLFPYGMRSAGDAHDEVRYNRTTNKWEAIKRIGEIDLGNLDWINSWSYDSTKYPKRHDIPLSNAIGVASDKKANILCAKYATGRADDVFLNKDLTIGLNQDSKIVIYDSNYNGENDAEAFKQSLQGVTMYYELANPIVVELDDNFNPDYLVWDFGTEEAISKVASAPFRANIIYQFNAVDRIRNNSTKIAQLEAQIASLVSALNAMQVSNADVEE